MVRQIIVATALLMYSSGYAADEPVAWQLPQSGFPVVTDTMRPGVGSINRVLEYKTFRSIAVVGADEISARWLHINNDYLKSLNVIGIVVNVLNEAEMQALRTYTDIPLIAMPGESLREYFGDVYPLSLIHI